MNFEIADIPEKYADEAALRRDRLVETLTDYDDKFYVPVPGGPGSGQ